MSKHTRNTGSLTRALRIIEKSTRPTKKSKKKKGVKVKQPKFSPLEALKILLTGRK